MALKFTVHVVQSFIKGHRKSGVTSRKHSAYLARVLNLLSMALLLSLLAALKINRFYRVTHSAIEGLVDPLCRQPLNKTRSLLDSIFVTYV